VPITTSRRGASAAAVLAASLLITSWAAGPARADGPRFTPPTLSCGATYDPFITNESGTGKQLVGDGYEHRLSAQVGPRGSWLKIEFQDHKPPKLPSVTRVYGLRYRGTETGPDYIAVHVWANGPFRVSLAPYQVPGNPRAATLNLVGEAPSDLHLGNAAFGLDCSRAGASDAGPGAPDGGAVAGLPGGQAASPLPSPTWPDRAFPSQSASAGQGLDLTPPQLDGPWPQWGLPQWGLPQWGLGQTQPGLGSQWIPGQWNLGSSQPRGG